MRYLWLLILPVFLATACGVRRPLIAPKDIPAYEERLEKKRQEREEFLREQEDLRQRQLEQQRSQPTGAATS